ncbi:MAG: hypothetical protein HY452_00525 [Parcubacteria group bacterium]|nr:hypothetical protein [Parcubacteria group bacterium]
MSALVDALAKTISLLFEIIVSGADTTFEKVKPTAKTYLKSLIITTLVWLALIPVLVILKAATGWAVFGYLAAVLAIMLTAALGLLYAPLGLLLGMLAGKTVNPAEAGERYLRFFGPVIFAVLMGSLYLARVPIEKNMEAVPVLFIAVAAVVIGSSIWGGWLSGRFYTFVAIVIMSLTTLSFFLPQTFETVAKKFRNLDMEIAELMGYRDPNPDVMYSPSGRTKIDLRETIYFPLVANIWSKEMYILPGEYFFYTGGKWFEYKKKKDRNHRNMVIRVNNESNETTYYYFETGQSLSPLSTSPNMSGVISKGEYIQFRTDRNCTARITPVYRR